MRSPRGRQKHGQKEKRVHACELAEQGAEGATVCKLKKKGPANTEKWGALGRSERHKGKGDKNEHWCGGYKVGGRVKDGKNPQERRTKGTPLGTSRGGPFRLLWMGKST